MLKKILLGLGILVLVVLVLVGGLLAYSIVTDYQPVGVEKSISIQEGNGSFDAEQEIRILTYNIGYGGLDVKQDFFMEGGKNAKSSSEEQTIKNLEGVSKIVSDYQPDVIAFQEVDTKSMRSFDVNEADYLIDALGKNMSANFAYNFKVNWIPKPWLDPIGYVESGVLTLAKAETLSSNRHALFSEFPIPERFFMLDRCLLVDEYPLSNGKILKFINVHLSAYDPGGSLRDEQLKYMIDYLKSVDLEKEYVVIAGDWNMVLGGANPFIQEGEELPEWYSELPTVLEEIGYKLGSDATVYTSRTNDQPYKKGENMELVIDGFYVSPNVDIVEVKGIDTGYIPSDHNPVFMRINLQP